MLPLSATTCARAYDALVLHGANTADRCQQLKVQINSGVVIYPSFVLDVLGAARDALREVPLLAQARGLREYVRAQFGDPELDLRPSLNAGLAALAALVEAIVAEYPRDPETGRMLDRTMQPDGDVVWATIPADQMPLTAAAIDAYLATLD